MRETRDRYSYVQRRQEKDFSFMFLVGFILLLFVLICESREIREVSNIHVTTATVTDKCVKGDDGLYLVFTKTDDDEIEVFKVSDSILKGRFNSSDVYAGIEVGKKYKFTYGGDRVRIFSWYPNIYEYVEVE